MNNRPLATVVMQTDVVVFVYYVKHDRSWREVKGYTITYFEIGMAVQLLLSSITLNTADSYCRTNVGAIPHDCITVQIPI